MTLSRKSSQLLARVNFPLYTVHRLTDKHILVAGGGGSAKTGIRNVIEIYELSNDGAGCKAKSVTHYETGSQAVMNSAVFDTEKYSILFVGMEGMCQLYKLTMRVKETGRMSNGYINGDVSHCASLRTRKPKSGEEDLTSNPVKNGRKSSLGEKIVENSVEHLVFDISPVGSFQTDFSDDPFQKQVRFSFDRKILATAGADGHIRVWKYPTLNKLFEIKAHNDDVDDLDISPLGDKIVSVSRDGHGKIWNCENGLLICDLQYELPNKNQVKYIFRSCRFAVVEGNRENPSLFVTLNPAIRKKPLSSCFLSKWDTQKFCIEKIVPTGNELISTMAVSDDGRFIGLGTQDGSVRIYIAFSLQLLHKAEHVHSIFVTGLEFLKSCDKTSRITGGHEASLISISVDNHISIHTIPHRATVGLFSLIILFAVTLFIIFLIMDYFNL